jgi:hypothetical protein
MVLALGIGLAIGLLTVGLLIRFSRMRPYLGNVLIPCCLIAVCLVFLVITFGFRVEEAGPALIPRLWIYMILVLSGIILWQVFHGKDEVVPRIEKPGLLALVVVALIGYFVAMSYLGYFLSSFFFVALLLNMLSYRKKVLIYVIAGGWCLFSYLVFYKLLYIQLPLGFFEDLF